MNHFRPFTSLAGLAGVIGISQACAGIFVDTSPGTAAPPATLGGYSMIGFPADPSAEGTLTTSLIPPVSAPVTGNLVFSSALEHDIVGSMWDMWSHGYTGDVYYLPGDYDLLMTLPTGTMAFYLYVQPNIKATFEFTVDSSAAVTTFDVDGNGGAKYVGFYSDDPSKPLHFVFVDQTTSETDFAVGEFGINVPEPGAFAWVTALGLAGLVFARRAQTR